MCSRIAFLEGPVRVAVIRIAQPATTAEVR
jgi:hypothetical protein